MRRRLQRRPAAAEAQLTQSAVVPRSQVRCLRCWQQQHAAWLPVSIHGYPLIAWCEYVLLLLLSRCRVQLALTLASEPLLTYPATPPRLHSTARPMSRCAWPVGAMFLRLRLTGGLVNTPATPPGVEWDDQEGFFCAGKEAFAARGIETC